MTLKLLISYLSLWETMRDNTKRVIVDEYMFWPESRGKKIKGEKEGIQFQLIVELFHLLEREWGQPTKQIKQLGTELSIPVQFSRTTERKETSKAQLTPAKEDVTEKSATQDQDN